MYDTIYLIYRILILQVMMSHLNKGQTTKRTDGQATCLCDKKLSY